MPHRLGTQWDSGRIKTRWFCVTRERALRPITPSTFAHVLPCLAFAFGQAGDLNGQLIMGRLMDGESLTPIPNGVLQLLSLDSDPLSLAISGPEGEFRLVSPDSGRFLVRAEALGYHTLVRGPVTLGLTDTLGVAFYIRPYPALLDTLVVEAERQVRHLEIAGFYRRQKRMLGYFLNREEIEESNPRDVSALLLAVPWIVLRPTRFGWHAPLFQRYMAASSFGAPGWCFPMYFLDGIPIFGAGREIDFLIHPDNIEAVEAYMSRSEIPVEYRDPRAACGVILIWTRR